MAKKKIRVTNVIVAPGKTRVVLFAGNHRYITSSIVLGMNGVKNPFHLRGSIIDIETFEIGEKLVNGTVYDQRDESTLIKRIESIPVTDADKLSDKIADAMAERMLATMGYGGAPAHPTPRATVIAMSAQDAEEEALVEALNQGAAAATQPAGQPAEQPAAGEAVPAGGTPADVLDESLPG